MDIASRLYKYKIEIVCNNNISIPALENGRISLFVVHASWYTNLIKSVFLYCDYDFTKKFKFNRWFIF